MLADRLRKLEAAGVVQRTLRDAGDGVAYQLTERGMALAPVMAEIRRWGADELTGQTDTEQVFDMTYALPDELHQQPSLIVETSSDFIRRWAAGETTWDEGRRTGEVTSVGTDGAWNRMLVATNYPGRRPGLAEELLPSQ